MTISRIEWDELKASEQYGMFAQHEQELIRARYLIGEDHNALMRLNDRLVILEAWKEDHERLGDVCPHTGRC